MPSFKSVAVAVSMALLTVVHADYVIDPDSVNINIRQQWCDDQENTCPILCEQVEPRTTLVNECDPETLAYGCLCGNNLQPNISEFSLTLPFHVCREFVRQCSDNCGNNAACVTECVEGNPCGAQNPTRVNATTSTQVTPAATGSPEETDDVVYTGPGGKTGEDDKDAGTALELGKAYSMAIVFGSLFAGFALL